MKTVEFNPFTAYFILSLAEIKCDLPLMIGGTMLKIVKDNSLLNQYKKALLKLSVVDLKTIY